MMQAVLLGATIVSTAALVVLGCLSILAGLTRRRPQRSDSLGQSQQDAVFIFRDHRLIDCSDRAQDLLATLAQPEDTPAQQDPLALLLDYLSAHFPDLEGVLARIDPAGQCTLHPSAGQDLRLDVRVQDNLLRLRLCDGSDEGALVAIDRLSHEAAQRELSILRHVQRNLPCLVWQCDGAGQVVWANAAYIQALQDVQGEAPALSWPLPALFPHPEGAQPPARLSLERGEQTNWYAHSEVASDAMVTHYAMPIDAAVQSEAARREVVQTLTRTFASLPIGLALFDAERRLQVFNPALVDLTGLQPLFLAARPSFEQVLYSLREARMLPEPKDFNAWRRDILDLEKAAQDGDYCEEWTLGGGKTYLVTGRPQPSGAIALFMQDITTEATLTRSFRAEIEIAHGVLDQLAPAVIVFGLDGQTLLANAAYARLWDADPCTNLSDRGLPDALALWSKACGPTSFWARLAEFVSVRTETKVISGTAQHASGAALRLTARRLAGGNTLLVFEAQDQSVRRAGLALDGHAEALLRPDITARSTDWPKRMPHDLTPATPAIPVRPAPPPVSLGPVSLGPSGVAPASAGPDFAGTAGEDPPRKPRTARHAGNRLRV